MFAGVVSCIPLVLQTFDLPNSETLVKMKGFFLSVEIDRQIEELQAKRKKVTKEVASEKVRITRVITKSVRPS